MRTFYKLLGVALIVASINNFVWFSLTYWAYLETQSVISTSIVGGVFLVGVAVSGFWLGSIVDHNRKKNAMLGSSCMSLMMYVFGLLLYLASPDGAFGSVSSVYFWLLVMILLTGSLSGGIYNIAIPTLVGLTVSEDKRDKANGLFGTVMGISFGITSVASGLALGFGSMMWVLVIAVIGTIVGMLFLLSIKIEEKRIIHIERANEHKKIDVKGTIRVIRGVPGLFASIFFTTFNNFLGGAFMALMDAYGLSLVSVQVWGVLWGGLSFAFIFGGLYISKRGLGSNPLRTLFRVNTVLWISCILFPLQPSIVLVAIGMVVWLSLSPFVEATEQTILQKVVPPERLGRVIGFAQSVEQMASPLTAFMIGPIAQLLFIPFMTTGAGVDLIGSWFGVGQGRGIALVFISFGLIGLIVTLISMRTRHFKLLAKRYAE